MAFTTNPESPPDVAVLLAEDDPHIRRVTVVALERCGFSVQAVADGAEALQLLEDDLPDVVILDGMMPKLDGVETCRRIRSDPRLSRLVVIMLSARSQDVDEAAGLRAGADAYIKKPFDALTLGAQVRDILARLEAA